MEDRDLTGVLYALTIFVAAALWSCGGKPTAIEAPQTTITGKVINKETKEPIAGAIVSSEPATQQTTTNAEGFYTLLTNVTVGQTYRVTATADAYQQNTVTVSAAEGENTVGDIALSPEQPK